MGLKLSYADSTMSPGRRWTGAVAAMLWRDAQTVEGNRTPSSRQCSFSTRPPQRSDLREQVEERLALQCSWRSAPTSPRRARRAAAQRNQPERSHAPAQ
jgi:hypothetical protein